jgi:tRNA U38,U39,U40 pseudouridine synthase TruA
MIDQEAIERIPAVIPHPSMIIDSLQDLVWESCSDLKITVTTSSVAIMTKVIEHLFQHSADHPAMANRTDTLSHAVLNISLNRSPESMTAVAKQFNLTKQAVSKKVTEIHDRLGIRARSQKSEKARESYRKRAYRVHAKRRREAPKFNNAALMKGMNK